MSAGQQDDGRPSTLDRGLVTRIAVAAVVLAAAAGGLIALERMSHAPAPQTEEPPPRSEAVVPAVVAQVAVAQSSEAGSASRTDVSNVPDATEANEGPVPKSNSMLAAAATDPGPQLPAPPTDAGIKPVTGPVTKAEPAPVPPDPAPPATLAQHKPADPPAPVAQKAPPAPPKPKPTKGPHLQAGMFLQATNAEELRRKLEAQGLPVYVESRVHVGPFKDRKEAEQAREKLKALGIATVLIP